MSKYTFFLCIFFLQSAFAEFDTVPSLSHNPTEVTIYKDKKPHKDQDKRKSQTSFKPEKLPFFKKASKYIKASALTYGVFMFISTRKNKFDSIREKGYLKMSIGQTTIWESGNKHNAKKENIEKCNFFLGKTEKYTTKYSPSVCAAAISKILPDGWISSDVIHPRIHKHTEFSLGKIFHIDFQQPANN